MKENVTKFLISLTAAAFGALLILLPAQYAMSACATFGTTVSYDLGASSCELCGIGDVVLRITHPDRDADLTGLVVTADMGASGLTFVPGSSDFSARYGSDPASFEPALSGGNDSVITWDFGNYVLDAPSSGWPGNAQILEIRFQVERATGLDDEGLVSADRSVRGTVAYTTINERNNFDRCSDLRISGPQLLPLDEPVPSVSKRGRNADARQGSNEYANTVYGHTGDDVIWRVRVRNNGSADLQDLRFDDLMQSGNFQVNYACPSESDAAAIASNNGVAPGGSLCVPAGNTIDNFAVDDPFGNPGNDEPGRFVDVREDANAHVYLAGKIIDSCNANTTNTVSDVQWGCEADPPDGGITRTSTGATPGIATATLSSRVVNAGNNLNIRTDLVGVNTSQPAGGRGTVRITIRNNTGGTVKGIKLRNVLPPEYVVDPTFTPTIETTGAYGSYPGMTDRIEWTNPVPGTVPLTTSDPAVALANTTPEFRLYSSTVHPVYADQFDLLRHDDELVVTFRVVLIRPQSYDLTANLDVRTEGPNSDPPGTDPANTIQVTNELYVDFEHFCQPGVIQHPPSNPQVTTHLSDPEDLDIDMSGSELVYILTGDPNQRLPLTVFLRNNGGHDAADYTAHITFGASMSVVAAPTGCSVTANPPTLAEWQQPAPIPADATVYRCTGPDISPGQTVALDFEVLKSTDPNDIAADDLTFRADVTGQITLSDDTPLWFPTPSLRPDGMLDPVNDYTLDGIRARVIGFNLLKSQIGTCSENNPPPASPDLQVQIGEECDYHIDTGGWFGFQTPGFTYIAVQDIEVVDQLPDGQGYLASTDPLLASTSAIRGVSLNPAGLAPLDEVAAPEWMNWRFNRIVPGERITEKDHWFRVDMRTRLLNDPVDTSALPNRHAEFSTNVLNSYFQAVFFNDTFGREEVFDLGPNTIGYPRIEVRRVDLTVTEPHVSVVKEVCNESLYGAGPACSNFVPLADDGDAYSSYIYRLTLTNEANRDGVQRAPAYDVTVTDQLDASDLAAIIPFADDGLDNDGDGTFGGADSDGEGMIGDNVVKNGVPAEIVFAYDHSDALRRVDPGQSVRLYYRVDFDDDAAPLQTFTNTATATYDSLAGDFGNQSAPQRPNSDEGGARLYATEPVTAATRIVPVTTQPKRIAALANTPVAGGPSIQDVVIGEEIEYRLSTLLPVALLRDFVIRDELPAGLICSEAPAVDLDAPPYAAANFVPGGVVTPTCSEDTVEWNFGDQRVTRGSAGNRFDFEVGFIARVENNSGTNEADLIANGNPATVVTARYIDETGTEIVIDFDEVSVQIREPRLELTQAFDAAAADAGDVLTVTVTATNTGTATAYNLRVLDDLTDRHLTFTGDVGGADPPTSVDTTTLGANRPVFSWAPASGIAPGAGISFTFDVIVDPVVQPEEVLDNVVQASWTSLPGQTTALNGSGLIGLDGSPAGMRTGALPNAGDPVNDYETTAEAVVAVPAVSLVKSDLEPGVVPTIGSHKSFRIDIDLPEGETRGVVVTDRLDAAGLSYLLEDNTAIDVSVTFAGIASVNGASPGEAAFNAIPADGARGSIVWDIGEVVTQTENDPTQNAIAPRIRIDYRARIVNDAETDAGDLLQNGAELGSIHGETGTRQLFFDATAPVTVVEPALTLGKSVANVTRPGNPPVAGDVLRYTLTFNAAGGTAGDTFSDAFDLRIDDSLSLGLTYLGNATVSGPGNSIGTPVVTGDGVVTTQMLRWSPEDGNADVDVGEGTTVTVAYDVRVLDSVLINQTLENSAVGRWTSLDGASDFERDGTQTPAWNDYVTGPAVTAVVVGDATAVAKSRLFDTFGPADDAVRVGDIVEYELRLGLQEGSYANVVLTDTLPAGLAFAGVAAVNGDASPPYAAAAPFDHADIPAAAVAVAGDPVAGSTTVTFALGDIVNRADGVTSNDDFVVVYRALVLNDVHPQDVAIALTNTAAMGYETATGAATTVSDSATVTLRQPDLTVSKSAVAAGGDAVLAAGETVTYTIDITNTGSAPAYDVRLEDTIPVGMRNGGATVTTVGIQLLSGADLPVLAPSYDPVSGVAVWDLAAGPAGQYAIPAGDTLRLVYQAQADTDLGAGLTLVNSARVALYHSFDGDAAPIREDVTGVPQVYGPSNVATTSLTTATPDTLVKQNPPTPTVAVGEPFSYRVTIPATPQPVALHDVRILDDLSASAADLEFIEIAKVSGSRPWSPVNTGTAPSLVIEDPTVGIDIPAGEQIVIDITVVLSDTATNVAGLQFLNTAAYTYNRVGNDPTTEMSGGSDTTTPLTIVEPDTLTLQKSGPATLQAGTADTFILDIHNPSASTAWNPVVVDRLPLTPQGGMCAGAPTNISARFFETDGVTPASAQLNEGTDFVVDFDGDPDCEWTFRLLSSAGGISPDHRLIVRYDTGLDPGSVDGADLINVAGVTRWFSADPESGPATRVFNRVLTDGTPEQLDHEDIHTVLVEAPVLSFSKSVRNVTSGQDPGRDAGPGDTLRYSLEVTNSGAAGQGSLSIEDELDRLNAVPSFAAGSLMLVNVPAGVDTSGTSAVGGSNGTGLVRVDNLAVGPAGSADDTVTVEFVVVLAPAITNDTVVRNQARLDFGGSAPLVSDDPDLPGDADPTETLIASSPVFEVWKESEDISGDPGELLAGDTLRYTLTVRNVGSEDAVNAVLLDQIPDNTSYVSGSTTLNGTVLADPVAGTSPLESGLAVNSANETTAGILRADPSGEPGHAATITFDIVVDPTAMDGLVIQNQGFLDAEGEGSGATPQQPSDDPDTVTPLDPTRDIVGNVPLLGALKTVQIQEDLGSPGIVDPGDVLRYTIVIANNGRAAATNVTLVDPVPADTSYVTDSLRLNGNPLGSDGGLSPLIAGITLESADNPGPGIVSVGNNATVTFDVRVNAGVPTGTLISNQGTVATDEMPSLPTDADGVTSNGYQPTVVVVGDTQLVAITKEVSVIGGGVAEAGDQLEYVIRATNIGSLPATDVSIIDDLAPLTGLATYVSGSGRLNGSSAGIAYAGSVLTADYAGQYGNLVPGDSAVVSFRVQIDASLAIGTGITNTAEVHWSDPVKSAFASVSLDLGGVPGSAALNGTVWHDADLDGSADGVEPLLAGWAVELYSGGRLVASTATGSGGSYRLSGLLPNTGTAEPYHLVFRAPGAGTNTPSLGMTSSPFTDGPQSINDIYIASGDNLQGLNLPITPNGVVYDSILRTPVNGARLHMLNTATGALLPNGCFDDPVQQGQATADGGFYKFDLNFSVAACPPDATYTIEVTPPTAGYTSMPSEIIPPNGIPVDPFSVPDCPGSPDDAVPATAEYCEVTASAAAPPLSVGAGTAGTVYHIHLMFSDGAMPAESQVFNNHIPIDPVLDGAVAIVKTSPLINVSKGDLVPYTIVVENVFGSPLADVGIVDRFPAGFKYVQGSARLNGDPVEPTSDDRQMQWDGLSLNVNEKLIVKLLLAVGAGVSEGEYVNRARVINSVSGGAISGEATATVRVVADPTFDCTDVIGKVFDDRNLNGRQDAGEPGLPAARVATVRGLIVTTDENGRFHIACATVPDDERGSNFILKLDERTLPSGYRLTTENPRVQRATRGKMLRFSFGATIHRAVRIDIAAGAYEPNSTELRLQWHPKIGQLLEALKQAPSVLRLSYLADLESAGLVRERLAKLQESIEAEWAEIKPAYPLVVETEIFWRRGAPVAGR